MIYDRGQNNKALIYAEIPPSTIEFITNLSDGLNDILISFNPDPDVDDWDNDNDPGIDSKTGLKNIQDAYFIIYYPEKLEVDAREILYMANKAIPHLKSVCGRYFYPDDVNGRKLPIYLSDDYDEFIRQYELIRGPVEDKDKYKNTSGLYLSVTSLMGCVTEGILLNGDFVVKHFDKHAKSTLWHEMTHYVFFTSLDYSRSEMQIPMWCYEGIAEYCGHEAERPVFNDKEIAEMRNTCDLRDMNFEYVYQNYSGGRSIYCYMEDEYNAEAITSFLETLYHSGVDSSLMENFSIDIDDLEEDWKENLDSFKR